MRRGEWVGTTRRMCACVYNGCVTWPRAVKDVLAINKGHHTGIVRNNWYGFSTINKGDCHRSGAVSCRSDVVASFGNNSSVFNQIIPSSPKYIRFYPTNNGDVGKTIRVFGKDANGQTLAGQRADGSFQDGLVLVLKMPYVQSPATIHYIDHVLKDATQGPVRGYQWDGTSLWDLAYYEASETAPDYRTSRLEGGCWGTCFGATPHRISALVRLRFIPVENDDDIVLVDNLDALDYAMQAIKYGQAGDAQSRVEYMAMAVKELNLGLWDEGEDSVPITNPIFGGTHIGRQQCF